MQDMFESAKRMAGTAVERAAWEADRMRRVNERQREVDLLQKERAAVVEQLAGVLLDLERRGELPAGPLQALAARLRTLSADMNKGLAEVQAIKAEQFVPGTVTVSVQRKDSQQDSQQDSQSVPSSSASAARTSCPTCGASVRRGAGFCPSCGARLTP